MTIATALWSFTLVAALLTLSPGLDTALILRTSALGNRRQAWGVVLGIQTGTLTWGVLTSLGITALLTASQLAYTVLRWVGAAYLVWMGARMLYDTWRRVPLADATAEAAAPGGLLTAWRRGALTNLLNPKVGVVYVAMLPQFIPPGAPHLAFGVLLTSIHIVLGLVWSAVLIGFARVIRHQLAKPAARRVLDRVTGTIIAGFGLRLAMSD
ncbi:LysE family translocator [Yinghuangia seranimata]|uniref:LysE family translocator n=1 Tax=Yinghuangia seranimata TaxID=408067 RepID=UPI00248B8322|nr:LysE family translocator [Yinghuangia seranimata]MDI2124841.1 LysE family translocator [Yinghuangia seranimata]